MKTALMNIWHALVSLFLAPGAAMYHGIAATPWGRSWNLGGSEHILVIGFAILFWCLLLMILGGMNEQIRRFLSRNQRD